jgi:hypothetical protein
MRWGNREGIIRPRGTLCPTCMCDDAGFTVAGAAAPATARIACMVGRVRDGMTSTFVGLDLSLLLSS